MNSALIASALALGVAGSPHCAAMCAAPCMAATGGRPGAWPFHLARSLGYMAAGALAAGSVNALALLGTWSPLLKPLWSVVHAAALALGLWLLLIGRQPAWMERLGRGGPDRPDASGWQKLRGPARQAAAGALWVSWPCGLMQSAVLVAALADGPAGGAAVMLAFSAASAVGLGAAPWIWRRLASSTAMASLSGTGGVRVAGALLALASAWALGQGVWHRIAAYCGI